MGNEAGDADSIISALALSYVGSSVEEENENKRHIPIVSIPRSDMKLRRDASLLLKMSGVDEDTHLLYIDDDSVQSFLNDSKDSVTMTLVDHNKLRSDLWHLESKVTDIVDHHRDEGFHTSSVSSMHREVAFEDNYATVGSTCTLVAERLFQQSTDTNNIDASVGLALLGVILLDTINMSPQAAKGTHRDEKAIDTLLKCTPWNRLLTTPNEHLSHIFTTVPKNDNQLEALPQPDRVKLHHYLSKSKFDATFWEGMTMRDALRIDYKRFDSSSLSPSSDGASSFGLSSVLLPLSSLPNKKDWCKQTINFMTKDAKVPLLGVLSMVVVDNVPIRELLLFGTSIELLNDMT
eukprot:CAMPEP_0195516064 /NCGR_PEP_ID=MMETSP0794_2-20130614/6911_1 /TAXON_ID=515487 /ORGANISM="Stephanopyxis turris, Strain CCMP 815" /LENGTH=348 /DNA_ID=CAMNT_0040644577 /DNA_START=202 /DNA_END=1244 /DNA_ORIENTATION=+